MSRKLLHENHLLGIDSCGDEHWESEISKFGGCIQLGMRGKEKRATLNQHKHLTLPYANASSSKAERSPTLKFRSKPTQKW